MIDEREWDCSQRRLFIKALAEDSFHVGVPPHIKQWAERVLRETEEDLRQIVGLTDAARR